MNGINIDSTLIVYWQATLEMSLYVELFMVGFAVSVSRLSLGDKIAELCATMTLSEHTLITTIRAFDESGDWAREGALTCAQWLGWRVGMGPAASRERIRVAKALGELTKIDAAFGSARISYSKVRAVTRVAILANEELLLEIAQNSTAAQLERICRKFRGCMQDQRPEAAELKRRVSVRYGDDGTVKITATLPADEGSRFLAAIESGRAALDEARPDVSAETEPGVSGDMTMTDKGATRADGLMALTESWFATGAQPRRGGAPHEVLLHVSANGLIENEFVGSDVSAEMSTPSFIDNAGGGGVSDQTARRLCCDASISAVVENTQGEVLDVGRKRRTVPAAIQRALEARHGRVCSFPGCNHTLFLDSHHIQHWANGGSTSLDNLCQLCRHHHTFVHEFGWRVEKIAGEVMFYRPDGQIVPNSPELPSLAPGAMQALLDPRPVEVHELSLATHGWGDPVDMVQVIDALVHETLMRRDNARDFSKEPAPG